MENNSHNKCEKKTFITFVNNSRLGQFIFLFVLIMILFYCIEVIPFYIQQQHSARETLLLIKARLPWVSAIAAIASLYIASRRKRPK